LRWPIAASLSGDLAKVATCSVASSDSERLLEQLDDCFTSLLVVDVCESEARVARRARKSGARKRKQIEIEVEREAASRFAA